MAPEVVQGHGDGVSRTRFSEGRFSDSSEQTAGLHLHRAM
jgi:hypothetical protein